MKAVWCSIDNFWAHNNVEKLIREYCLPREIVSLNRSWSWPSNREVWVFRQSSDTTWHTYAPNQDSGSVPYSWGLTAKRKSRIMRKLSWEAKSVVNDDNYQATTSSISVFYFTSMNSFLDQTWWFNADFPSRTVISEYKRFSLRPGSH